MKGVNGGWKVKDVIGAIIPTHETDIDIAPLKFESVTVMHMIFMWIRILNIMKEQLGQRRKKYANILTHTLLYKWLNISVIK